MFFLWFLVVLEDTFEISMNISNVIELWCTSMNELLFILLVNIVVMFFGSYLRCLSYSGFCKRWRLNEICASHMLYVRD